MKILVQRVINSKVKVENEVVGEIGTGILALVAIEDSDTKKTLLKMSDKLLNYRIFSDMQGKMNLSLMDIQGELLLVSQFTLAANTHKGLRPSFSGAADPEKARKQFAEFIELCRLSKLKVATGIFAADMQVSLVNDGPVSFMLESSAT